MIKISVSTIKKGKVYGILPYDNPTEIGVTRKQFEESVARWASETFDNPMSIFTAIEPDLYSMIIVLDINNDHDADQQVLEIPEVVKI